MTFCRTSAADFIERSRVQPKSKHLHRLLLNVAILFLGVNEKPNFVALSAVAAAADRSPPPLAAPATKQRRRRLRGTALIEVA
jgi:hypothetical protein